MAAKIMSIDQMEQFLIKLHGKPDGKVAGELEDAQLTERVNPARLAQWETEFPGPRAHKKLMQLADLSASLDPPASDVVPDPLPDPDTQRHILWMAEQYMGTTMSRLPDFFATRETNYFEDISQQPNPDSVGGSSTKLQWTNVYNQTVTYRDGREVPFEDAGKRGEEPALGLTTHGEFGPILSQVLNDALENQVGFLRWEQGPREAAVFSYAVPENASHFQVNTRIGGQAQTIRPAYHGEIEIDPATGEILRLSEIADMTPPHQALHAAIEVEYGSVTIGGRNYICPVKGVAFSKISVPTTNVRGVLLDESVWPIQTHLNDVAFTGYHQFRSEARIVGDQSDASR
jgi:hypothetical protein